MASGGGAKNAPIIVTAWCRWCSEVLGRIPGHQLCAGITPRGLGFHNLPKPVCGGTQWLLLKG